MFIIVLTKCHCQFNILHRQSLASFWFMNATTEVVIKHKNLSKVQTSLSYFTYIKYNLTRLSVNSYHRNRSTLLCQKIIYIYTQHNVFISKMQALCGTQNTKGVFGIRKSTQDRQHNDQKIKDNRTNNDLQNIAQKTNGRATKPQLTTGK